MPLKPVQKTTVEEPGEGSEQEESGEPDWFKSLIEQTEVSKQRLDELVEEKMGEYPGLLSKGSAAVLVGRDLGINLVEEVSENSLDIANLVPGMSDVVLVCRVEEKTGVNSFDGGRVANWRVSDETGETQVTFWDEDVEGLYRCFDRGDKVRVVGGYTKKEISDYQDDRFGVVSVQVGDDTEIEEVESL